MDSDQQVQNLIKTMKHLLAGGIAGAVSRTCVSPLERLKIIYQVTPGKLQILQTLIDMYRKEGFHGYFKGNGTNVIRMVPYSAVQFASFEYFKKHLLKEGETELTPTTRLVAGAGAGLTSVAATYPLDLIRTRLSVQSGQNDRYTGIISAFRSILAQEGFRALFKGIVPTMMGIAPYVGLNFLCYETFKSFVRKRITPDPTTVQLLVCGGAAGTCAQTITYPLDVIRRKMQMQGFSERHPVYGTTWNCIKQVFLKDGILGFYRGLIPNYLKVVPSIGITFMVYERVKQFLGG